jgi:hypothetical protein
MILTISYFPKKDAENYIRTFFDHAYEYFGQNERTQKLLNEISLPEIKSIFLEGKDRNATFESVTKILESNPSIPELIQKAKALEEIWKKLGDQIVFQLESLYGINCPFGEVHVDLTTLTVCPYDYKNKQIFVHALPGPQAQLRILSHELNHFFFYYKYTEQLSHVLNREQFELLKESLTIFTNPEQAPKPNEISLRKQYIDLKAKTIDEAVEIGRTFLNRASEST